MGARQISDIAKLSPNFTLNMGAGLFQRFNLADKTRGLVNTVVTNVPGPPIPLYSAGAQAIGVYGMLCLIDGIRLGHIVHTYQKEVTLSFTACREAMPDPDFYAKCIRKSYNEHATALALLLPKSQNSKNKSCAANAKKPITKKTPAS